MQRDGDEADGSSAGNCDVDVALVVHADRAHGLLLV
jgi:hypothetical protein